MCNEDWCGGIDLAVGGWFNEVGGMSILYFYYGSRYLVNYEQKILIVLSHSVIIADQESKAYFLFEQKLKTDNNENIEIRDNDCFLI